MPTQRAMMLRHRSRPELPCDKTSLPKAAQPATPVNFEVPAGACDCHTHIFGDPKQFPFFAGRVYTPETALARGDGGAPPRAAHRARGDRDAERLRHRQFRHALRHEGARRGRARRGRDRREDAGTASSTPWTGAGIRGIRINLATGGTSDPALGRERFLRPRVARVEGRNWHVQMYTNLAVISGIKDLVLASPVPVVFDHFGGAQAQLGLAQPGFAELVALVRAGKAYVKISGAYRGSSEAPDYADTAPLAKALIAANPDRIVWGTDWPHPNSSRPPAASRPT